MSSQMTTHVSDKPDSAWPLVYLSDWEATAKQAMSNTGARYIGFTPLVQDKDRFNYEMFMLENRQGSFVKTEHYEADLEQAAMVQGGLASRLGQEAQSFILERPIPFIFQGNRTGIYLAQAEVYAPVAQVAPLPNYMSYLNFDGFSFPLYKRVFEGMVVAKRPVLSEVLNYDEYFSDDSSNTSLTVVAEIWTPASFMLAPIYDRLEPGAALVGALAAEMPWDAYFSNLIPEGIDGIVLVVRNTCGQQVTFEINGPEVTYLGIGDWHDPRYDEFEVLSDFETAFTSLPECTYSLHLYPSEEFVMSYHSHRPRVYTMAVACIFVLVSLIFVVYDWMVERRQEKVMHTAVRSSDIVNSLFPANVRDRLMDDAMQKRHDEEEAASPTTRNQHHHHHRNRNSLFANLVSAGAASILNSDKEGNGSVAPSSPPSTPGTNTTTTTTKGKLTTFAMIPSTPRPRRRSSATRSLGSDSRPITTSPFSSRPIADLFPNSTVLFGDLVGFTAWSSVRQPSQVFILLETLYFRFDQTAKKFGVFKVETIGDCYGMFRLSSLSFRCQ
jgi:hypothetical protein